MIPPALLQRYEALVEGADRAFERVREAYPSLVRCKEGCADCCYAPFALFPIEAAYLGERFRKLARSVRRSVFRRAEAAEKELSRMLAEMRAQSIEDPFEGLARGRIRCPLLDPEDRCVLYVFRPITCRVYGIPTAIRGKGRVCGKSGFKRGETYPTFHLDRVYDTLYTLSAELLEASGRKGEAAARVMVPLSRVITGRWG